MNSPKDTIAAISTFKGEAAIGVVRITGDKSHNILARVFRDAMGETVKEFIPRVMKFGYIVDGDTQETIDEAQAVFFRNPKTYTGEDVVEISCHGGILICEKVLDVVLKEGARPAERGEFTLRAFLNGKIDLTKAEAILEIISAKNDKDLELSVKNLKGAFLEKVKSIRREMTELLAEIEVEIEYSEEDFQLTNIERARASILNIELELKNLLESFNQSRVLKGDITVVIAGRPNVGKSSIMNRLLNTERAIVHDAPGTTRDLVIDWMNLSGIEIMLIDTAGVTETTDPVERKGIEKTRKALNDADIIIYVMDATKIKRIEEEKREFLNDNCGKIHFVLNKIDLLGKREANHKKNCILTSAKTGEGINEVKERLMGDVFGLLGHKDGMVAINIRQKNCIESAMKLVDSAKRNIKMPLDVIAIDIHEAMGKLSEITGENATESILNEIFSKFCVGK